MRHLGQSGMVASPHYLATAAGLNILRRGGNAVDAAIATNAVLAVVTPYLCGLGGDLFAIVYTPEDRALSGLNSSGRAPAEATLERVAALAGTDRMPQRGPLPITVPGCVAGWEALHDRYGRVPLDQILADAIRYAGDGFPVSSRFAHAIERSAAFFHPDTPARETFLPGGQLPREGQIFRQPRLAETLATIAREGWEAFYRGVIADELARSIRAVGGLLATEDLQEHRPLWVQPLCIDYRGVAVYELPPNSQGIVALLILNILKHLPAHQIAKGGDAAIHLLAETARLAYADRDAYITDPDHMRIAPEALLSDRYGRERARLISERALGGSSPGEPGGTAYMCTADSQGNLVSLIESNYMGIGSGVMAGETGVMLQNRGAWFSLQPGHVNAIAPRKRTMHTLMPAMAFRDGKPWLVFGTMGGGTQPQIHVQILTNLVDRGMPLDAAIASPRFDAAAGTDEAGHPLIAVEEGFPPQTIEALIARGHAVQTLPPGAIIGHAHAIQILDSGTFVGAADPRTESLALGY